MTDSVELIDVGPRDGLQNLDVNVTPGVRAALVNQLLVAGVDLVEAVSFMSESRVPQMAGAADVIAGVDASYRDRVTALVPNQRGFQRAAEAGLRQVRCVVAASDEMNRANFGVETDRTVEAIEVITRDAAASGIDIGVIIGTAFGCPYER
ncbi:MAG: hydroxymethylglutaryl-CoA lyase, partial [Acidimicrobiia bacterium]